MKVKEGLQNAQGICHKKESTVEIVYTVGLTGLTILWGKGNVFQPGRTRGLGIWPAYDPMSKVWQLQYEAANAHSDGDSRR